MDKPQYKLLPCPFCGDETPEFERMGTPRQSCIVVCERCGCRHESSDEGEMSGISWNERAAAPSLGIDAPNSTCQQCNGSGDMTALVGGGPDAYDETVNCNKCGGTGAIDAPEHPVRWQSVETAPKDGTEVLAWRADCGQFIASFTSASSFPMSQAETDALDEEALFAEDWFTQWPQALRLDGSEKPTHWQPLPSPPAAQQGGGDSSAQEPEL